jgi:hypothetical protein
MNAVSGERRMLAPPRSIASALAMVVMTTVVSERAQAQVYQLDGGTSSLLNATGATVEARTRDSSMQVSAGRLFDVWTVGALFKKKIRDTTLSVGDDVINFDLPSDLLTGGHYVPLRGVRLDGLRRGVHVSGFVGTTSTTTGAPFFRGGDWGRPLVVVFADQSRPSGWRLFSRNVLSSRRTFIQGVEWLPHKPFALSIAGGIGNDKPYASSSASLDYRWFTGKAVLASHPIGFRRIEIDTPGGSELQRENVSLVIRPERRWSINVARQNLVQDVPSTKTIPEVTVNQAGGLWNADGLRVGGTLFNSNGSDRKSLGSSLTIGRQVTRALDLSADYFRYAPRDEKASHSASVTARENIHPRLNLLQVATRSGRQTSVNVGGEFLSNPVSVSVSYQTIYAPLKIGNPFVQVVGVDLRAHGPRGLELRAGTYATASGSLKYTISAHQIVSRTANGGAGSMRFPKYQVRGFVTDTDGHPVAGAVMRIGAEIVITGEDGGFVLSVDRGAPVPLVVLTDEFLAPGVFDVVSAPPYAAPGTPSEAREVRIVLRRR